MAESFEGPVTVADVAGGRKSVLDGDSLLLGRTVSRRRRGPGFPGPAALRGPGGVAAAEAIAVTETVLVDLGNAERVPDVLLDVGDRDGAGGVTVRDETDQAVINFNGANGFGTFGTNKGPAGGIMVRSGKNGPVILISGQHGRIIFMDRNLRTTLAIDAAKGDIELLGADCAEDFDLAEPAAPGSVLSVEDGGRLRPSREPYDRRVVGVISGAGDWNPGLRLARKSEDESSVPLALVGRVYCLADASIDPIGIGDLLTTSSTPGHAMRAADPLKAFGSVLGKSLGDLPRGCGLLPILVALQ
jgi:hypothetical protein